MKLPERLVVTSRPWAVLVGGHMASAAPAILAVTDPGIGSLAMRLFVFALGAGFSFVVWRFLPFLTLVLDRDAGTVAILHHRVTGTTATRYPLSAITGAMYQSDWSDNARLERLALRGPEGPIPVEFGYSGAPRAAIASEVDAWISAARE